MDAQYKTALHNCNVIDVITGETLEKQCIAIGLDGSIAKILPTDHPDVSSTLKATEHPLLDCEGGYVIPGLIDCHVHVTAFTGNFAELERTSPSYVTARAISELKATLRRGFTTIRDAGGADHGLARALEEGVIVEGPRLLFCGKALSQTGGHGDMRSPGDFAKAFDCTCSGLGRVCDGDAEVRKATRDEIRKGATHIKVMAGGGVASPTDRITSTQFSVGELKAIVEEADAANIHVMAHAYTPRAIMNSVKAGIKSIEHGNLLNMKAAKFMAENGTYLVPTLATYDALAKEGVLNGLSREMIDKVGDVLEAGKRSISIAQEAGVTICYATDLLSDMRRHQLSGLGLLEDSGMPTLQVLQSATINAARLIDLEQEIGTIGEGKVADMIVLKENPLASSMAEVFGKWEDSCLAVYRAGIMYKATNV